MVNLIVGVVAIFIFMMIFNYGFVWVAESNRFTDYRIRTPVDDRYKLNSKYLRIALNGIFALILYGIFTFLAAQYLLTVDEPPTIQLLGRCIAILLLYDFLYYWMHRAFHTPLLMKHIHGTHHKVRYPTAHDGLYLNPIDNFAGLSLFFISVTVVAPISVGTLLVTLFAYLLINNINHTGLTFNHPLLWLPNYWARKHDHHHGGNIRSNYGSIVPFWDMMFGTYE